MRRLAPRAAALAVALSACAALAYAQSTVTVTEVAEPVVPVPATAGSPVGTPSPGGTQAPEASAVPAVPAVPTEGAGIAAGAMPSGIEAPASRENALSRFEIVAFGCLPIALFYSNLGFDLYRFALNDFDSRYAPWPFSGSATSTLTDDERLQRMGTAALVSLAAAAADFVIRTLRDSGRGARGQH